jgi:glycosyltransferase involved in cell wall biosynthesis
MIPLGREIPYTPLVVSVCIPVYNEAATIASVIDALRREEGVVFDRVMVCANGCTDHTCAIVRERAGLWPAVTLIERTWRGKARAWNELFARAEQSIVVFLDGDITLPPGTIVALVCALTAEPQLIAVSAQPVPRKARHRGLDRLIALPTVPSAPTGLCGGCYAVRPELLRNRLAERGYRRMPERIIAEDRWLSEVIGPKRWRVVPEAPVLYAFPALRDLPAQMKRHTRARLQLQADYPHLQPSHQLSRLPRSASLLREWGQRDGRGRFLRRILTAMIVRGVGLYAWITVLTTPRSGRLDPWDRTPSTKRTVTEAEPA